MGYVLGSHEEAPINLGSVLWSTELSILSLKGVDEEIQKGIEIWFQGFDKFVYEYLLLSIFLFSSWFTLFLGLDMYSKKFEKYSKRMKMRQFGEKIDNRIIRKVIRKSFSSLIETLWNSLLALVDEQMFKASNYRIKFLVSFYLIAIFNLIFGYFLNLISVDMIAVQSVQTIDTLQELMEGKMFKNLSVVTVGGLWQESALKSATVGSLERKLSERIREENYIPMDFDPQSVSKIFPHLSPLSRSEEVIVIDRQAIRLFKSVLCQCTNIDPERYHASKDWFGERLLCTMISKSSDEELLKWSRYKFRQLFQSHIAKQYIDHVHREISVQPMTEFKKIQCAEGITGKETKLPDPFKLKYFIPSLVLSLYIFSSAFICLIVEIFCGTLKKKLLSN